MAQPAAELPPEAPPPSERESRLELVDTVARRPWWKKAFFFFVYCGFALVLVGGAVGLGIYYKFSKGLPEVPRVEDYRPPILTEFRSDDGALVGEFYKERRKVVPYEQIPKKLVQAFIAAEDKNFFDHFGLDIEGTLRAASKTLRGQHIQGGSTLTQQTAKSILVNESFSAVDFDAILRDADSKVAPAPPPAKTAIDEFVDSSRRARLGNAYNDDTKNIPPSADELKRATDFLNQRATNARNKQVQAVYTRLKEAALRQAFKEATVRTGKLGIIRKIREAILSRRLEKALTKEEILYLYLNNIYLGHHAYGVQTAAENYFRKDVKDLTLAEMATLAGLPQSPSANPYAHPQRSKERRAYVLGRMLVDGMISQKEYDDAMKAPVKAYDVEDVFHDTSPFFAEQVRRDIVDRYGNERLLTDGLTVDLTMDAERQREAQDAMLTGLIEVDKRQGYYGPLMHFTSDSEKKEFEAKVEKQLTRDEPVVGGYYPAVVTKVDDKDMVAELLVGTHHKGKLPLAEMRWARKPNPEQYYPSALISHVSTALKVGDVALVRLRTYDEVKKDADSVTEKQIPTDGSALYSLEQEPQLQGAIVSIDPHKDYVPAMIGGYDYDASEFNRAFQACRQPGSAFKPVEYSAAIEQLDYTASTIIVDSPIVFDDPDTQLRWKPENYENDFKGDVIVRTALMESMNIPAIKVFQAVGIDKVRAWAKNLGITTEVHSDLSSALGSSCVHPWELAQMYAVFDRDGKREPVYFVRQVRDRNGRVLEDHTAYNDPWASSRDRIRAGYARLFDKPEQVMEPETAFLTTWLLHDVATGGTGANASRLNKPVAGKTGTTNDSHDTWFVGYTHDLLTAVWLGYDDYKHDPMGKYEAGSRASLPIWLEYMKHALEGVPQPWFQPAPGADIVWANIDPKTGKLAHGRDGVREAFKRGNEPKASDDKNNPTPLDPLMTP